MVRLVTEHFQVADFSDTAVLSGYEASFYSENLFGQTKILYTNAAWVFYDLGSTKTELYCAFIFQTIKGGTETNNFNFAWCNENAPIGGIGFRTGNGKMSLIVGTDPANNTVTATGSKILSDSTPYLLELYVKLNDSTGIVQTKIDGVLDINYSGDTIPGAIQNVNRIAIGTNNSNFSRYGWLVVNDTSGSEDNSWPGLLKFKSLFPTGDGNATSWTASSGNRYACVDDNPPNSDTDYVSSATNGQRNSFTFDAHNLPSNASIKAYINRLIARKDTAGQVTPYVRISSTNYDAGSAIDLGTSYKGFTHRLTKNPNTTNDWSLTDAPEMGVLSGGM